MIADSKIQRERKHPVHLSNVVRPNEPVILFVTVCTKSKQAILAKDGMHALICEAWGKAHHWSVGHYLIMPDHIHLFCSPAIREAVNVKTWIAYWKRLVSQSAVEHVSIWQRDCWDTQLRSQRQYEEKWKYVQLNPVRAGLVSSPDEWVFKGFMKELRW